MVVYLKGIVSSSETEGPEGEWCLIDLLRSWLDLEFEFKRAVFGAEVGDPELK